MPHRRHVSGVVAIVAVVMGTAACGGNTTSVPGTASPSPAQTITLAPPRAGQYTLTQTGTVSATVTETVTTSSTQTTLAYSGVETGERIFAYLIKPDGLYWVSQSVKGTTGSSVTCTLPQPLRWFPNPLTTGDSWNSTVTCPGPGGESDTVTLSTRIIGVHTITIAGKSVDTVEIDSTGTVTSSPGGSSTYQGSVFIDPLRGLVLRDTETIVQAGATFTRERIFTAIPPL